MSVRICPEHDAACAEIPQSERCGTCGPALAYGMIDPDYARIYTQARVTAWQYGFACVMHGSFTRDLDLLLVPWDKHACDAVVPQIIRLIADQSELLIPGDSWDKPMVFTLKPHGRRAISLLFPAKDRRWVDISAVPCGTGGVPVQPY